MPKPNEVAQIDFIVDCLRKGEARKIILAKFVKKWQGKSNRTFDRRLRQAENALQAEQTAIRAQAEESIKEESNLLKIKIRSFLEKKEHIQKMIDDIETDIQRGIVEDYFTVQGKVQIVNKIMNAETKAYLRKTIKELYAELNKMEGDYAKLEDPPQTTVKIIIE